MHRLSYRSVLWRWMPYCKQSSLKALFSPPKIELISENSPNFMLCIVFIYSWLKYRIYYSTWIQKWSCGWEMWAFSLAYSILYVWSRVSGLQIGGARGMGSHGGNRGIQEKNWDNWGERVGSIWGKQALGPTPSLILWYPGHATEVELSCNLIFHLLQLARGQ